MRTLANQLVLILLILTLCGVWAGKDARAVPLGQSERQRMFGGQDGGEDGGSPPMYPGCRVTVTDCPDVKYGKTCTYNAATEQCEMCYMQVTNYIDCMSLKGQPNCDTKTTAAYCGTVKFGDPDEYGMCTGMCINSPPAGPIDCGKQIPQVTGVDCPP